MNAAVKNKTNFWTCQEQNTRLAVHTDMPVI